MFMILKDSTSTDNILHFPNHQPSCNFGRGTLVYPIGDTFNVAKPFSHPEDKYIVLNNATLGSDTILKPIDSDTLLYIITDHTSLKVNKRYRISIRGNTIESHPRDNGAFEITNILKTDNKTNSIIIGKVIS